MRWREKCNWLFALAIAAIALPLLTGCSEMPEINTAKKETAPRLVLGPYFTEATAEGLCLRFQADRPCTPGLRFQSKPQSIKRYASSYGAAQALAIKDLQAGEVVRCDLLLDDIVGPQIELRAAPVAGAPVSIAFIGAPPEGEAYRRADEILQRYTVDRVVLTASPFKGLAAAEVWAEHFFSPLAHALQRSPLMLTPPVALHLPRPLRPAKAEEAVWSEDIGCLHLIALEGQALRNPAKSPALIAWLEQDLAKARPTIAWTAVVISEPLFSERHINVRALEALDIRLERAGVPLVISGGTACYHRTVPLASAGEGRVRYLVAGCALGGQSIGREYTAACSREVCVSILTADQGWLEWKAYSASGRIVDSFRLNRESDDTGEPMLDKQPIMAEAQAVLALRREALAIARQACRAVVDPTQPQTLAVRLANPSPRPFNGTLEWVGREDFSWRVAPSSVPFALAPGQEMSVRFTLSPTGKKGAPPIFEVRANDLGVARQPLIFTPLKSINLPLVDSPCRIDGSFENEPFWNTAAKLEDFTVTATDAKPSHVILCRLAANAEGILVAIRCEAEKPAKIPCKIAGRDGPVYEDESVEVFIDPTAQGKEYLQFSVNLSGAFLDRSSHFGLAWNPPWQQAIKFADNYYDVEILIPYRSLGLSAKPRPGDRLGINICRNDYRIKPPKKKKEESVSASADKSASAGLEVVQWAQTMGNNGRPGCYGQATFVLPGQAPAAGR